MVETENKVHPKRRAIDEYFHNIAGTEAIVFNGLDEAIMGVAEQHAGVGPLVAYSMREIINCYELQGMSHEEAVEFFGHNCQCLSVGEGTPIIVDDYSLGNVLSDSKPDLELDVEQRLLNRSIHDLNLPHRASRIIARLGVNTIKELVCLSDEELSCTKGFGITSLDDVKNQLALLGLKLRDNRCSHGLYLGTGTCPRCEGESDE